MNDYLVSIIIPVYNSEKYLNRCLQSVTTQTYSHIEIIIINDGSTDASLSICERWKETDDRVIVFSQDNCGQGAARNNGLDRSSGEFVMFIDSDDFIHPQMVELLLNIAVENSADIVQCGYKEVFENEKVAFENISKDSITIFKDVDRNQRILCNYTEDIIPVNKIIKKDLLKGKKFPLNMYYEDKHLMFRLRYFANLIITIQEKLYYYVQTPSSTMRQKWNDKRFDSSFRIIDELTDFCLENELEDNYLLEISGCFRTLLSMYYHANNDVQFRKYLEQCKHTLKKYLPILKRNKYVKGKYKLLAYMLCINFDLGIEIFCHINKIRQII